MPPFMLSSSRYSPADSLFPLPDRRASPRFRTVCFDVKVDRGGHVGLFRARNISDAGIMLNTHVPLSVGEELLLELSEGVATRGTVLWCNDRCCGVQFERPIDCAAFLEAGARLKREDRRAGAMRLAARKLATTYAENGIRAVRVLNASRRGLCLAHDGTLASGMPLKLVVESGLERDATVRWSKGGRAGIRLMDPLNCAELDRICGPDRRVAERDEALLLAD